MSWERRVDNRHHCKISLLTTHGCRLVWIINANRGRVLRNTTTTRAISLCCRRRGGCSILRMNVYRGTSSRRWRRKSWSVACRVCLISKDNIRLCVSRRFRKNLFRKNLRKLCLIFSANQWKFVMIKENWVFGQSFRIINKIRKLMSLFAIIS